MLCRALRLKPYLELLRAEFPELPEINFTTVETTKNLAFPLYLMEQVLPQDRPSGIHLAYSWTELEKVINLV